MTCNKKVIKFIDLFAGMGGLRLGFEQAFKERDISTECVMTSEIKDHAIEALKENFKHNRIVGDITKIKSEEIPDFDFLLGGFPCQSFSSAGNRYGFLDTRGTLFFEIERILRDKRPYGFILENVEGLITHDRKNSEDKIGQTLKVILETLTSLGYKTEWKLLDSKKFGVPQSRKRVFIVGTLDTKINLDDFEERFATFGEVQERGLDTLDTHFTQSIFKHFKPENLYGKAIKDKRGGKDNIHSWTIGLKGEVTDEQKELLELLLKERRKKKWAEEIGIKWMDGMPLTLDQISTFYQKENLKEMLDDLVDKGYLVKEHPKEQVEMKLDNGSIVKKRDQDTSKDKGYNIVTGRLSFEFTRILDPNNIAPTLVATDVSKLGIIDNDGLRRLTLKEGLRLFGYPEEYSLEMFNSSKSEERKAYDLLGNTVVVPVVKDITLRIIDKKEKIEREEKEMIVEQLTLI